MINDEIYFKHTFFRMTNWKMLVERYIWYKIQVKNNGEQGFSTTIVLLYTLWFKLTKI